MAAFRGARAFLSNFHFCPAGVVVDGIRYPTSEHAFMAQKTLNRTVQLEISQLSTPGMAKRFGRLLELRPDWEQVKIEEMRRVLRAKFSNLLLASLLVNTGDEHLTEYNEWHDNFWGSCTCARCANNGHNWLGRLLMELRTELNKNWAEAEGKHNQ